MIGANCSEPTMNLQFCGAAQTVTGSKHLLTTENGKQILLDCGMYQGRGIETDPLNRNFGFDPNQIHSLVLSHAHIDHSGLVPRLVREGFKGKIYCTPATADLCEVMLLDSAFIQENDALHLNQRRAEQGLAPIKPLYTEADVRRTLSLIETVAYGETKVIDADTSFTFSDTGHILGSAAVHLALRQQQQHRRLTFTGDIGRPHDHILRSPEPFEQADYIICESTYGNRLHPEEVNQEQQLFEVIYDTCLQRRGKVIIPAFSLDRTQELVYALDRMKTKGMLPPIKVFVDSPLSVKTTKIMRENAQYFNDEIISYMQKTDGEPFIFRDIYYISEVTDSKRLNQYKEPCIIISASGMAEAGRIKHHIANNIGDPRNTILLVGYCSPASLGARLKRGDTIVKIFGQEHAVKAQVHALEGYSAHADFSELINYLSCQDAQRVKQLYLVHGEPEPMQHFSGLLRQQGYADVQTPALWQTYQW